MPLTVRVCQPVAETGRQPDANNLNGLYYPCKYLGSTYFFKNQMSSITGKALFQGITVLYMRRKLSNPVSTLHVKQKMGDNPLRAGGACNLFEIWISFPILGLSFLNQPIYFEKATW